MNRQRAIVVNYLTALTLGLVLEYAHWEQIIRPGAWLYYTFFLGFLFITLFNLMAKVTQNQGVAVVSMAVKMSLALPVVVSLVLFNERISLANFLGLVLAFVALYAITWRKKSVGTAHVFAWGTLLLFFGSGLIDVLLKWNQMHHLTEKSEGIFTALTFGSAAMYGFAGLIFKKIKEKESLFTWRDTLAGILLGLPNYGSIYFLIKVLQIPNLNASIAFPINNLGIVVLSFLLSIFLFKEKPETLKILGFFLALVAIALMIF